MITKHRINFLDISTFEFRSGSIQAKRFKNYKIDFDESMIIYYDEIDSLFKNEYIKQLHEQDAIELFSSIDNLEYYNWNEKYIHKRIKDGHQWSIKITSKNNKNFIFNGSNAYPNNWEKVSNLIQKINEILKINNN